LALGFDADYRYQNVYVVDSSGTLLERWWAGSTWSSWSTLSAFPQPAVTAPGSVHLGGTRHVTCIGLPSNTLSCMIWNGSAWGARSDFPSVVSAGVLTLAADASAHLLAMDTAGHLVHFRYSTDWQRVPDDGTFAPLSANRTVRTREPNALLVRGNLLDLSRIPQSTPLLLVSPTGNTRPLAWRTEQRLPHGAWSHLVTGQGPEARTLRLVRVR
jgi:hypothetical protein